MKLTISVNLDNDAFQNEDGDLSHAEISAVLRQAQSRLLLMSACGGEMLKVRLLDSNGNTVGYVELSDF